MSDIYADVEAFVRRLRQAHVLQLAQALEDAMLYGATSGEILTNIAYILRKTREDGVDLPAELAVQRDMVLDRATTALRDVGQR